MHERHFYVYIITNSFHNVLYIGMTNDLSRRVHEHRTKQSNGFSKRYNLNKLVYYELHHSFETAADREKQLKNWHRPWKDDLISKFNPKWNDLYNSIAHG